MFLLKLIEQTVQHKMYIKILFIEVILGQILSLQSHNRINTK